MWAIQATDTKGILAELCRIFDVEADLEDFEVDVSPDEYLAEKKEAAAQAEMQERIKAATSEVNMEFLRTGLTMTRTAHKGKSSMLGFLFSLL